MSEFTFLKGPKDWWRQAVVYQIYPRSFADANGDGIGDLRGIINKADYLKSLNIDAVWLSPFYPSELADGGYDVADYRDVDPRIGTLAEFDELVDALHSRGIRIFVDIVRNHSSDQHVWFQEALKSPKGSKERARYIFRDGKGENGETFQRRLAPLQAALKERIPNCQCEFTTVRLSEGHRRLVRAFQMLASTPLTERERIGPARTGARQVCLVEAPARRAVLHGPGIYRCR